MTTKTEAEIYAEFLRELSMLSSTEELDVDELRGAADFIMRQQAELEDWKQAAGVEAGLRREFLARAEAAELSYDAHYLHSGGG